MTHSFRWPEGKRVALSLTFDDARFSQATTGLPLLDKLGAKGVFYVSLNLLDHHLERWRKALADGHEIGNHTATHPCTGNYPWSRQNALEDYTLERLEKDITDANAGLLQRLNLIPATFAYPCGQKFVGRGEHLQSYVPVVAKHFKAARGFRDEYANDPSFCDFAQLGGIDFDNTPADKLIERIKGAAKEGRWVIFAGHEVSEAPRQAVSPEALEALCKYALDPKNGVWLDTVATISRFIQAQR